MTSGSTSPWRCPRVSLLLALVATAGGMIPDTGRACPLPKPVVSPQRSNLAPARRLLRAGRYPEAVKLLVADLPRLRGLGPRALRRDKRYAIGLWVAAVAITRTRGAVAAGPRWRADTQGARAANRRWAARLLRALLRHAPKGQSVPQRAQVSAMLGELLSQGSARDRKEAYRRLLALAKKKRLRSSEAWAALARLHRERGRREAAQAATEACRLAAGPTAAARCAP